uniref:NTP-PPase-like protein n=1 Tax=Siphoviridae sp. ctiJm4 TaxID=2827916 RepID=A0A8S5T0Y8_9CAUD|nr:MAG TPA: NTP-PPase-like protein [Siphoviridae sp. ctiJm4]
MKSKDELTDLVNKIEKWAVDLGLNSNSNPLQQTLKYYEEVGELAKAIQQNNLIEIMDGIGDSVVVGAVMGSQLRQFSINEKYDDMPLVGIESEYVPFIPMPDKKRLPNIFYSYTKDLQKYINYCITAYDEEEHGHYLFKFYGNFLQSAHQLALCLGIDFNKCVKMAYATIHFRSGEIVDGIFIKRLPEAIIKIPTKKLELSIDNLINEVVKYAEENRIRFFKVEFDLEIDNYNRI